MALLPWRRKTTGRPTTGPLGLEVLEARTVPSATASVNAGVLTVNGSDQRDSIRVLLDAPSGQIVVQDFAVEVARFAPGPISGLVINAGAGDDAVVIDDALTVPAVVLGDAGDDAIRGGGGVTTLLGGDGNDKLTAGAGSTFLDGQAGANTLLFVKDIDTFQATDQDRVSFAILPVPVAPAVVETLSTDEVNTLLQRAAAASASNDAIIAIVDRGGRLLGVRTESGVSTAITGTNEMLTFGIDGAMAKARTGAFFGNNQAPLTSRTIQYISQTTMTQREIESNPNIPDINSTVRGPGFVAPIGVKNHFPPEVPFTPQVDLFAIEHTNRDGSVHPGADHIRGTADDVLLPNRFNVATADIPTSIPADQRLAAPDSYGYLTGLFPNGQSRGIGTLPGGIPIFENGQVVGGIGVFFPGQTGFATEENSALDAKYDPTKRDRSMEAEYIAFAAVGGTIISATRGIDPSPIGAIAGISLPADFGLPTGRIDLVGITLDIFGPGGREGTKNLLEFGQTLGVGDPNDGVNRQVTTNPAVTLQNGTPVPEGWLVTPHDGDGITAAEAQKIVEQGIAQANETRAAIRLPLGQRTRMVFAVADKQGEIVALFRMPDATVFSIDVAVAKARNVSYYADPNELQPQDQLPGLAPGTALTNRSFRYLSLPRNPEGIDGSAPGPFSIFNDGGVDPNTGLNVGAPLPASRYQSIQGFDAFNPQSNFHNPNNPTNQNGIVFFPGSSPLYRNRVLIGGFGVSGDGVDQDDVVTGGGQTGFGAPDEIRVDQFFVNGLRIPYQKFNRNPLA